jgi:ketosteroid isomerase-like protein
VAGNEADHEALRRLKSGYEQAIRENRVDALRPYLHADFHGVMVTGRAVDSFEDLQKYWRDIKDLIGEGGTYTTTVNPELSEILGDVALARGTTDDVVVTNDRHEFRFRSLWTAVLQKQDGQWKIRRVHGSIDPVDNPFVREFMRRAIVRTAGIGTVAGLVLGLLVGLVWGRRRARRVTTL